MEITKKGNEFIYVTFGELDDGDTFIDPINMDDDTTVFMKVGPDWDDVIKSSDEDFDWVAIRLDNGDIYGYGNCDKVVRVNVTATFTISGKGE